MSEREDDLSRPGVPEEPTPEGQFTRQGAAEAPPIAAGPEREVQHEPQVLEGDDQIPRQPAPPLDPYTPEPGPRPGERRAFRAMWLAWAIVAIVVAVVVIAALR